MNDDHSDTHKTENASVGDNANAMDTLLTLERKQNNELRTELAAVRQDLAAAKQLIKTLEAEVASANCKAANREFGERQMQYARENGMDRREEKEQKPVDAGQ